MFIGRYVRDDKPPNQYQLLCVEPQTYAEPSIAAEIDEVSQAFRTIYTQAAQAESYQLDEIAGVGYRKALEFLVKDYCIWKKPDERERVEKEFLASCIRKRIEDHNIRACAELATWLGNDETHYMRRWMDKDINDLKRLIALTMNWISNSVVTQRYRQEMDKGKT